MSNLYSHKQKKVMVSKGYAFIAAPLLTSDKLIKTNRINHFEEKNNRES